MRNFNSLIFLFLAAFFVVACEKEKDPVIPEENPFELEADFNGFAIDSTAYSTPNAIIEVYDATSDGLSSDFDISFTDGYYDSTSTIIKGYSLLVYFDANSPDLNNLSPGIYEIENTNERKPFNIVNSYIQFSTGTSISRNQVISGQVEIEESKGYYLVKYNLLTVMGTEKVEVNGQYTGMYTVIDKRIETR